MATADISGDSSPLSSIPGSEGLSLPSLSQATPQKPPDPAPEDTDLPGAAPEPPAMSESRPKRTRAAQAPKKEEPPKKVAKRAPKKRKIWDAENILSDPKSPLAKADLRKLLLSPMSWDILNPTDKQEILAALPPGSQVPASGPQEEAKPDIDHLKNDDTFRYDCASYIENLALGRFEAEWLESAWTAHQRRKMGDYDDFQWKRFEEVWETVLPEEFKVKRTLGKEESENVGSVEEAEEAGGSTEMEVDEVGEREREPGKARLKQDVGNRKKQKPEIGAQPVSTTHEDEQGSPTKQDDRPQSPATGADAGNHERDDPGAKAPEDDDKMVLDELHVDYSPQKKKQTPLVRRPNLKMEVDGEDSADELA